MTDIFEGFATDENGEPWALRLLDLIDGPMGQREFEMLFLAVFDPDDVAEMGGDGPRGKALLAQANDLQMGLSQGLRDLQSRGLVDVKQGPQPTVTDSVHVPGPLGAIRAAPHHLGDRAMVIVVTEAGHELKRGRHRKDRD